MKNILTITFLFVAAKLAFGADSIVLSEALIKKMIAKNPPSTELIEASFLESQRQYLAKKDALGFRLDGEGQIYRSKERLLNNFDGGVTRNATSYSVGIVKPTNMGVDIGLKAFGNKATNAFVSDASTEGLSFSLSVDLYKDFLGRTTNNDLKVSETNLKKAEFEKKASLKTFESNVRKLYWALVANNEQKLLLSSLVDLANTQYKESVRRNKSGVADSGEVARYRSQLSTKKASLLSLTYQRGEILKSLKQLLPELNGKEIVLNKYSVDKTVMDVLSCSATISSYKEAPFKFTPYDEIVDLINQAENLEQKVISAYDDPSIKLVGEYSSVGRGFGFEEAGEDFSDTPRARTSLGLKFSIPFGGRKHETAEVTKKLAKKRYLATAKDNLSKIKAFHSETASIINVLKDVVKNQKETNKYLAQSLKVSRRKYKQARISVQELISEQDSLLQSRVNEIQTNLTIINTLMDYFSIYNDIPCPLNRI